MTLSPDQQAHSDKTTDALKARIQETGPLSFAEFMQFALYEPGLGYYVSGNHKLGAGGDFVTAPMISPLFSACLGNHCARFFTDGGAKHILEFGAGTGEMALGILKHLEHIDQLPDSYSILEVSPELQERQRQHLKAHLPADIFTNIHWLYALPETNSFSGMMLANEVIDAMAVERVCLTDGVWQQQIIALENNELIEHYRSIENPQLQQAVNKLPTDLSDGYLTEVNTWIEPWIQSLSQSLQAGQITLIDYGFLRDEYYHPQRHMGTLMCHFQHQAKDNPLQHIGLQDITAHVDFSVVGESAEANGMTVIEYCNQAQFLIDSGLTDLLSSITDRNEYEKLLPGVQQLTLPQEMGELFKVMCLEKTGN